MSLTQMRENERMAAPFRTADGDTPWKRVNAREKLSGES